LNRLRLCTLIAILGAGDVWSEPIEDVLSVLAITRDELGIRKSYLPDPDRLTVQLSVMADPLAGRDWLETYADSLIQTDARGVVRLVGQLLDVNVDTTASGGGEVLDAVKRSSTRVRSLDFRGDSLIGLVHPDSTWRYPKVADAIRTGRSVAMDGLLQVAADLLASLKVVTPAADVVRRFDTPFGRVVIGTFEADTYEGRHALIVDPGGDDHYVDAAGVSSVTVPVSITIDLAGDDHYSERAGVGRSGVGVLVDVSGNDVYEGGGASFGAGVGGVGLLVDQTGNDRFESGVGAQGFGLYGVGILIDGEGEDTYVCSYLGQGAAGPGGVGLLLDRKGNDRYSAGGVYPDFRESQRYFQSMSQGFSFGLQTEASGGVGLLVDAVGSDRYEVSYFGQGASHWAGLGGLYDGDGNDTYLARRYAQGCGVHLAAGVLVDRSGDDLYSMWGVGQGCGHDLAVGVLSDVSGDDRYTIDWLGQGAGNANGIGLLLEGAGDDIYSAASNDTQGYGSPARDYGSIGLLIDSSGKDTYRDNARTLILSGSQGARLDVEGSTP